MDVSAVLQKFLDSSAALALIGLTVLGVGALLKVYWALRKSAW